MGSMSKQQRQLLPKADPERASTSASPGVDEGGRERENLGKRRCISSACMPCRKRKSKCDGDKPTCTACREVYSSECFYDLDADHRRKGALKRDISQLSQKVSSIGAVLDAIRAGSEADVDDIIQLIRSNPDQSHENMAEMIKTLTLNKHSQASIEPPSSLEGQLLMGIHGKASMDKPSVSSHYGHTSNFSLQKDDDRGTIAMEQVEIWTTVTSDIGLINEIMAAYFAWVHPVYLCFSEELFQHGMLDKKSKYCTPLLVNAILAVGCPYLDRPETRIDSNNPIGDLFFTEAKRLLAEDDNTPALTIVQALALMSLRQAMYNHDSSGRRYAAQMMSMAVELGLHTSHSIQTGHNLTGSEIEARKVTLWGVFVLEQIWSIAVGRIPTLPRNAIWLDKPTVTPTLENTLWRPHGYSEEDTTRLSQPSYKYSMLTQFSMLLEIVDDILRSFYAPRDRITSRKLQMHHEQLKEWYRRLPTALGILDDGPTLPQVITLHIFYHNCVIQTFRPFLKVSFVQASDSPRQICTASANRMSQLFELYKKSYDIRRSFFVNTHCNMSAAIIHLVNISSHPGTSDPETEKYLADAIRIMYEQMQNIVIVGRYMIIIRDLIHKWCKVIPPRVREAMEEVNIENIGTPPNTATTSSNIPPDTFLTNNPTSTSTLLPSHRRPTEPDIFPLEHQNSNGNAHAADQENLFWTPYPESFEGVPLAIPLSQDGIRHMDITHVLDSGVHGDWPQWNRDGFTMGAGEEGVLGMGGGMGWGFGGGNGGLSGGVGGAGDGRGGGVNGGGGGWETVA